VSSLLTVLQKRLDRLCVSLGVAYDTRDKLLASTKESASMDTGDGRVSFKNRDLDEIDATISRLESDIQRLEQRIAGKGVINVRLRRNC
jgi:hypothetical protein